MRSASSYRSLGWAWLGLAFALALHVVDEALNDFLSVYNPSVARLRSAFPFLPLPTFTFASWLTGLIIAIAALFLMSPFVFRGARWGRAASFIFAGFMFLNGMGHIVGSIYFHRLLPGTYSAPLLLVASIVLFVASVGSRSAHRAGA